MAEARKEKPRKLKVFQAQFGFYDSVVAAPSQAAALRAWGARQNLFKDGDARLTEDERAIEAALERPEIPLRRPVGSNEPFSLKPRLPRVQDLPDVAAALTAPKAAKSKAKASSAAPKPIRPKPPPPDRSAMDAAEAALQEIGSERKREEQGFEERRAALDNEERVAKARYAEARSQALKTLRREQQAYIKAGGRIPSKR